jgi:ornithine--oxo-acid transaminase
VKRIRLEDRRFFLLQSTSPLKAASADYATYVNPQWQRLLSVLGMNVSYDRCSGSELFTSDGRRIVDFLSGYCVHNAGHNHPEIIAAVKAELDRCGPAMLQSHVPELAGELAGRLCARAGGELNKVFFCSSGSEGVETAIKFARAKTGRAGLLYNDGAFHGLTCGALSMMGDPFWRGKFGPMLAGTEAVPFGDIEALGQQLATRQFAAFFMEPIQAEGGIRVPTREYMQAAQALCRKHGTLFVLDEVQTGMYRTGPFLAGQHFGVHPDMVVLAKALSGGLIPVGAVLMTDPIYDSVFDSLRNSIIHASTFSENSISMRAGLATLDVLERGVLGERLGDRAIRVGDDLREKLRTALAGYEMFSEMRGAGLLSGIAFVPPKSMKLRLAFEAFRAIHPGMFGQVMVMRLYRDYGFLTQMCGNNFMVLKAAPPLIVTELEIDQFVAAVRNVVDEAHTSASFWTEALGMARRLVAV